MAAPNSDDFSERFARVRLPLMFATLLALILAARLDFTRGPEAVLIAYGLPAVAAVVGALPFRDAHSGLRAAVFACAAVLLAGSELRIFAVFSGNAPPAIGWLLLACVAFAIILQALGARRGLPSRMAAWFGLAATFAWYFPNHMKQADVFGSFWGAFFVAFFLGGGVGLLLGEVVSRVLKRT